VKERSFTCERTLWFDITFCTGSGRRTSALQFVKNSYGVTKSVVSQVHEWVVYGDIEIKDYVVLQNPQEQTNSLPPPHTLILDFTMTHTRFGRVNFVPYYTTYSHKDSVQMVLLRLMVLCRQWSGIKYDTIIKFTSVVQTQ
jgi:hypothetical protein